MKPQPASTVRFPRSPLLAVALSLFLGHPAHAQFTVVYDFDSDTPPTVGTTTPFDYLSSGVKASFISLTTGESFSVQRSDSVPGINTIPLAFFSGNFLNPNSTARASLEIKFDQPLSDITLAFATAQSTAVETPNPITFTAYLDSTANPVGSPITTSGNFNSSALPYGSLTFTSDAAHPFNMITLVMGAGGAGGILADNISVTVVPEPMSAAWIGGGLLALAVALRRPWRLKSSQ